MVGGMARVRRALGCIAGAAMVGVLAALLVRQTLHIDEQVLAYDMMLVMALSLAAGLGVAVGFEAVETRLAGAGTERPAAAWWVRWVEVAELILLGVASGALSTGLVYARAEAEAVEAVVALAAFGFGVTAALMIIRWRIGGALRAAPLYILLGVLYGLSMVTGQALAGALLAQPCRLHGYCLEFDWQAVIVQNSVSLGLPVGLCLGIMLWAALSFGRLASMSRRQVHAQRSASGS